MEFDRKICEQDTRFLPASDNGTSLKNLHRFSFARYYYIPIFLPPKSFKSKYMSNTIPFNIITNLTKQEALFGKKPLVIMKIYSMVINTIFKCFLFSFMR